jgi:hypothetical protein
MSKKENVEYLVEVIVADRRTHEDINTYEKTFIDRDEAHEYRESIEKEMQDYQYTRWSKVIPVVTCHCGEKVYCTAFTNTCDRCEADYNFNGELLADRSQWGEETGESWQDCY